MEIGINNNNSLNYWPAFVDALITLFLLTILIGLVTYLTNTENLINLAVRSRQSKLKDKITNIFPDEIAKNKIRIYEDGNLQRISFSDKLLFPSGDKTLKSGGKAILTKLKKVFSDLWTENQNIFNSIQVEGHADPRPYNNEMDNWFLSTSRAIEIVKFFIGEEYQIREAYENNIQLPLDPSLFSATGYSFFHPPDTVDTKRIKCIFMLGRS